MVAAVGFEPTPSKMTDSNYMIIMHRFHETLARLCDDDPHNYRVHGVGWATRSIHWIG